VNDLSVAGGDTHAVAIVNTSDAPENLEKSVGIDGIRRQSFEERRAVFRRDAFKPAARRGEESETGRERLQTFSGRFDGGWL